MGADGGTIPVRCELVTVKKKKEVVRSPLRRHLAPNIWKMPGPGVWTRSRPPPTDTLPAQVDPKLALDAKWQYCAMTATRLEPGAPIVACELGR